MKKILKVALALLLLLAGTAGAQAQVKFGIRAGLNVDKMHLNYSEVVRADNSCGFTGGAMVEAMIPILGFGIDAAVMYTRMNTSIDVLDSNTGFGEKIGKNFIEIPVNLKYKVNIPIINHILRPYVFTGPDFAFKLDKNTAHAFRTKTCQVGWDLGLGVELFKHLQVGAGYTWNINGVAKYALNLPNVQGDVKAKNNYWTVTAAWLF